MNSFAATPVQTDHASALVAAAEWLRGVLLGSVGMTIAVLAIATVGFGMLTGRIAARRGMRVVLGCFILFGASTIAASLMGFAKGGRSGVVEVPPPVQPELPMPKFTPPPARDPYAGASVPN